MSKYIATMTSTHNGKLLVDGEVFEPSDKSFKEIDINCLLNNGRIRPDYSVVKREEKEITVEEKMADETPVLVETEEKNEVVEDVKSELEFKTENIETGDEVDDFEEVSDDDFDGILKDNEEKSSISKVKSKKKKK